VGAGGGHAGSELHLSRRLGVREGSQPACWPLPVLAGGTTISRETPGRKEKKIVHKTLPPD